MFFLKLGTAPANFVHFIPSTFTPSSKEHVKVTETAMGKQSEAKETYMWICAISNLFCLPVFQVVLSLLH